MLVIVRSNELPLFELLFVSFVPAILLANIVN